MNSQSLFAMWRGVMVTGFHAKCVRTWRVWVFVFFFARVFCACNFVPR